MSREILLVPRQLSIQRQERVLLLLSQPGVVQHGGQQEPKYLSLLLWHKQLQQVRSSSSFEQTKYLLRILRCSLFGQRGNLTTKPNKWQYCVSGPLCCFVLHNLQANQIGLERSVSWLLLWDRITGDMGSSYFISLRKDEEGKRGKYLRKYIFSAKK